MVLIKLLTESAKIPTRKHEQDAGFDLYCPEDVRCCAGQVTKIHLGIAITDFPPNTFVKLLERSSHGALNIKVVGGVIDANYQGEIILCLSNSSNIHHHISKGERCGQMIFQKYEPNVVFEEVADFINLTDRGEGGFGSTGK